MGATFGRVRTRLVHTDTFSIQNEDNTVNNDGNMNPKRYRQKSLTYQKTPIKGLDEQANESTTAVASRIMEPPPSPSGPSAHPSLQPTQSSKCAQHNPILAFTEVPHAPFESKGTLTNRRHTAIPGNNGLVALKYAPRPELKPLMKAATAKVLATSNENPVKFRRKSICPDLGTSLSMAFTVDVLADPVTLKLMTEFAMAVPYAAPRLLFWADAQHLRSLPSAQYTDKILRKIYEKFLSPTAPTPICVPTHLLHSIHATFESPNGIQTAGVYAEAQALCLRDLEKDVFPRFRRHRLYAEMLTTVQEKPSKWKAAMGALHTPMLQARENHESFQSVLANDYKLRFFKSYCVENLTLENLMFHLDVEEAKRLPNQSFVQARARKIIDTYFRPHSKQYIHLSPHVHDEMLAKYDGQNFEPTMFTDAQYIALEFVRDQVWAKFSASDVYVKHIQETSIPDNELEAYVPTVSSADVDLLLGSLDTTSSSIFLQKAMELPTSQLANIAKAHNVHHDTALILLQDKIAHRIFKRFLRMRGKDHYVSFIDDVEEYSNLPGIEFMQHTAKKLFKKYLSDNARLQVDMSTRMRADIEAKLTTPTIDMFKPAIVKVKMGLLQDSLFRYLASSIHSELQDDPEIPHLVRELSLARDSGKLELPHLDSVLGHPKYLINFRRFLATQHAAENLIFLEEVDEFRRLPSSQIVLRNAKKIVDKYINPATARSPLPLSPHLIESMIDASADSMEKSFFTNAVRDVMGLLRHEEVPDFLDAPMFMVMVGAWAMLDETYARKQLQGDLELAYFRHRFHAICESKRTGMAGG
ncbi:Aste57867_25064 [Aphanomyces stellatus]|uniref:Aste57867_25064 protein n=1 Tax=Aphanomyces stellatus TaxID=120398 RepID=A0A485LS56_9STRA|nr:hypothetical protein As57867_024986 [Aphanomyces stellatus]VFU01695.1 Aste57867_25064 [Aphanomyces stellatus]